MKDPITTPGKTYAVTSPNGCTVTTDDGLTLAEIEAGKQGYFVAVSGKVQLSDEAAVLTQVFKLAPQQKLALLGVLGGGVPAWFKALKTELTALMDGSKFELAWLAGEKKLVVHTDRLNDTMLATVSDLLERVLPQDVEVVRYNHNMEISWRDINKYAECITEADMLAVNPDYKEDVPSDGEWCYPLPSLEKLSNSDSWSSGGFVRSQSIVKFAEPLPKIKKLEYTFRDMPNLKTLILNTPELILVVGIIQTNPNIEYLEINAPKAQTDTWWGIGTSSPKLHTAKINIPQATFFRLDRCQSLSMLEGTFTNIRGRNNSLAEAQLNKASALHFLNSLGAYEGTNNLIIGIHVDHKTDEEVLAAIANAESKGWTLTVQWNGTPTAQAAVTYGLRKPPIYARVCELERPDGTVERVLDWGHYVTDPSGYEEFRSVEAAEEYFNIKPTE